MLEHGRCEYEWLNEILDKGAIEHANNWGCFWNRDIDANVREAGLMIEESRKHHLGTMSFIIASK